MKKWWFIALIGMLAGCTPGLSGTYGDEMGVSRYVFRSDGKITVEVMGVSQQTRYSRDGDQLRIQLLDGEGTLDFSIAEDGSLSGPMGVRLLKLVD